MIKFPTELFSLREITLLIAASTSDASSTAPSQPTCRFSSWPS